MTQVEFIVYGNPKTAGSKRAFINPHTKKIAVVDSCKQGKDWRLDIKNTAIHHSSDDPCLCPVRVELLFMLPRPKYHYRADGSLKEKYKRIRHTKKPDIDKLSRAVLDALTGVIWKDDSQVYIKTAEKTYSSKSGCVISVELEKAE